MLIQHVAPATDAGIQETQNRPRGDWFSANLSHTGLCVSCLMGTFAHPQWPASVVRAQVVASAGRAGRQCAVADPGARGQHQYCVVPFGTPGGGAASHGERVKSVFCENIMSFTRVRLHQARGRGESTARACQRGESEYSGQRIARRTAVNG